MFAAYAAVPLWKKLGIKERSVVATLNSPDGLEKTLGQLPKGARLTHGSRGERDLTLWFVRKPAELQRKIASLTQFAERGGLWLMWQKGGSAGSLTQASVRETGLAHGLVDFRVSSIDATWSGLRFTLRK